MTRWSRDNPCCEVSRIKSRASRSRLFCLNSESCRPGAPRILHAPCIPADEGERLMALRSLGILDTAPEESFDRVTRLTAKALAVPIVLVCLVDETRQWFKSRVGLAATQTSREVSFCGHAVFERKPLVIPNAWLDPRFAGNPLVTSAPHIRAYLGVPLYTRNRQPIGTLCAIDVRPRAFAADETAILSDYAGIVQQLIQTQECSAEASDVLQRAQDTAQLFRGTSIWPRSGLCTWR
jgi:GAF domain-containing protein